MQITVISVSEIKQHDKEHMFLFSFNSSYFNDTKD